MQILVRLRCVVVRLCPREQIAATELVIRSADGVLRKCRNLCLAAMLEAVRASAGTTIDIDLINRVLLQPHWQKEVDLTDF